MSQDHSLNRRDAADAVNVARAREAFSHWLRQFELDAARHGDAVLAVNEALANSAEFAYLHHERPGMVTLAADYDPAAATLTVTIADEGTWREPTLGSNPQLRGRGIPLMQGLADVATIAPSPHGTTVSLRFDNINDRALA